MHTQLVLHNFTRQLQEVEVFLEGDEAFLASGYQRVRMRIVPSEDGVGFECKKSVFLRKAVGAGHLPFGQSLYAHTRVQSHSTDFSVRAARRCCISTLYLLSLDDSNYRQSASWMP
jgi:hypothetical protein